MMPDTATENVAAVPRGSVEKESGQLGTRISQLDDALDELARAISPILLPEQDAPSPAPPAADDPVVQSELASHLDFCNSRLASLTRRVRELHGRIDL